MRLDLAGAHQHHLLVHLVHLVVHLDQVEFGEAAGMEELPQLEQIYFQQNRITKISHLENLKNLEILDLALNQIEVIEGLDS